jgi:hypothetical protein
VSRTKLTFQFEAPSYSVNSEANLEVSYMTLQLVTFLVSETHYCSTRYLKPAILLAISSDSIRLPSP